MDQQGICLQLHRGVPTRPVENSSKCPVTLRRQDWQHVFELSEPSFKFYDDIRQEVQNAAAMIQAHQRIMSGDLGPPWRIHEGLVLHGNRVFIDLFFCLMHTSMEMAYCTGHEGVQKTLQRLQNSFYVDRDRALVKHFINSCTTASGTRQ